MDHYGRVNLKPLIEAIEKQTGLLEDIRLLLLTKERPAYSPEETIYGMGLYQAVRNRVVRDLTEDQGARYRPRGGAE